MAALSRVSRTKGERRAVVKVEGAGDVGTAIILVQNWFDELQRLIPRP